MLEKQSHFFKETLKKFKKTTEKEIYICVYLFSSYTVQFAYNVLPIDAEQYKNGFSSFPILKIWYF